MGTEGKDGRQGGQAPSLLVCTSADSRSYNLFFLQYTSSIAQTRGQSTGELGDRNFVSSREPALQAAAIQTVLGFSVVNYPSPPRTWLQGFYHVVKLGRF